MKSRLQATRLLVKVLEHLAILALASRIGSRPYHCSIATDDQGNHIGLDSEEEYVKKKNFTTLGSLMKDAF
ncbi:hypothetical protein, partial [Legionella sp. 29fVS95]|uniref:hypothetical protein n=1 Tax=Legionella sp. 29fVS95 TaxID=3402813 RepID=UPI003AF80546